MKLKTKDDVINYLKGVPNVTICDETTRTYSERKKNIHVWVGCDHDCTYCNLSFKPIAAMGRLKLKDPEEKPCEKCKKYEPHAHPEELSKIAAASTEGDEFIWIAPFGDLSLAPADYIQKVVDEISKNKIAVFLIQTKNPALLYSKLPKNLPDNLVLDITLETNKDEDYALISGKAPEPSVRYMAHLSYAHNHKWLTIEPIYDFDHDIFLKWIKDLGPERIYIGYESHDASSKCDLPYEPSMEKFVNFIKDLAFTKVYVKRINPEPDSIRSKLWDYENEEWEKLYIDPKEIKGVSPYNARKTFPDRELDEIVISLKELGINTRPIILDENNEVVEGGRRYRAALLAQLPKVFCLKKKMSPKEKKIRSFVENELAYPIVGKDRFLFAKDLRENEGMTVEEIGYAIGRSPPTIYEWLGYEKLPESIKHHKDAVEAYQDLSPRKKLLLSTTLDAPIFKAKELAKEKFTAAVKVTKAYGEGKMTREDERDLKEAMQDAKTFKDVDELINLYSDKSCKILEVRIPQEEYRKTHRVVKIKYPKKPFILGLIECLKEWVEKEEKRLGLMR